MIKRDVYKSLFWEFFRYLLVGGSAFLLDLAVVCICNEIIFSGKLMWISVFLGYTVGLIYNFMLSNVYVFKNGLSAIKGKEITSFIIFAVIGIIGLGLTELFMYIFVKLLNCYYVYAKILTGALVVFWNYIARKLIIYRENE